MNRPPLTATIVAEALTKYHGNMAAAARALTVNRSSVWKFVKKSPDLTAQMESLKETMLDHAESALQKAVLKGEAWAICFFLKTQGKSRGYTNAGAHPLYAELRQAEADALVSLGQLLLTPRSRSSARLATDDMDPAIEGATPGQAKLLKYLA